MGFCSLVIKKREGWGAQPSLHVRAPKKAGGSAVGGGSRPPLQTRCENACMVGRRLRYQAPPPPPHLQTQCSHDGFERDALKQFGRDSITCGYCMLWRKQPKKTGGWGHLHLQTQRSHDGFGRGSSQAKPAKPGRAKPSQANSSQAGKAKPSQARPSRATPLQGDMAQKKLGRPKP